MLENDGIIMINFIKMWGKVSFMYLTIKELAEYLKLPESFLVEKINEGTIRTVSDGEKLLINKEQFNKHLELVKKRIQELKEEKNEPIPEDYDVKDED